MGKDSAPARLIGYVRVSTDEQALHGYGLDAQVAELERASEYAREDPQHPWEIVEVVRDEGLSAATLERPALQKALQRIAAGDADGLVVAKLDRLTRSVVDFGDLVDWFSAAGAAIVALDLKVDTSTPSGRMVANVIVSIAEWERETIAARTKAGLAAKRAKGERTGRAALAEDPELVARIRGLRDTGLSLGAICRELEKANVPTARGGTKWRPSALQKALGYERPTQRRRRADLPELPRRRRRRA